MPHPSGSTQSSGRGKQVDGFPKPGPIERHTELGDRRAGSIGTREQAFFDHTVAL